MEIEHYARSRQIALGSEIGPLKKIYLDVRFWIFVRDAANGKSAAPDHLELLDLLREGVASDRIVCPISETTFVEILKQTPADDRRSATAAIVDELSGGVALIDEKTRIATEIAHLMYRYSSNGELHDLADLMWTKVGFCFGQVYPFVDGLDEDAQLQQQRGFFDYMWGQPLSKLIVHIPHVPYEEQREFDALAERLDSEIKAQQADLVSFRKTYRDEIVGAIDAFEGLIDDVLAGMAEEAGKMPLPSGSSDQLECQRMAKNLLIAAFDSGKAVPHLRTLHAMANLHAGLRWDRRTVFEGNHFYDFSHASGAIAYCDAFFTEGFLANLINGRHIRLDLAYGCPTTNRSAEAVAILRNFLGKTACDPGK